MENSDPRPDGPNEQNIHEFFRKLLTERDGRIRQLTDENNLLKEGAATRQPADQSAEMAALLGGLRSENEQLQSRFSKEKADLIQQLARQDDEVKKLREENQIFKNAGLGERRGDGSGAGWLLWLLFAGLVGFGAFFGAKWRYKKPAPVQAAFEKYRDQRQFQFEYDINQGQFEKVEAALDKDLTDPKLADIQPQIEFLRKIVRASGRTADSTGSGKAKPSNYVGLAEKPATQPAPAPEKPAKKKTLTINYDTPVTLRHEATATSEAIRKLSTGTVLTIIDRTLTRDKVRTAIDGTKYELRDYWYRVETDGQETGWVFGFFTNRSQQMKYALDAAGEPIVPGAAPAPGEKAAELPSPATTQN